MDPLIPVEGSPAAAEMDDVLDWVSTDLFDCIGACSAPLPACLACCRRPPAC